LLFFLNKTLNDELVLLKSDSGGPRINFGKFTRFIKVCKMNYLAHAYLSFNMPDILTGNMISDFIKGKKQFDQTAAIQKGIRLHRAIDNYTDTHEATQQLKNIFRPQYRLYSGAFADVVYDHFLAIDHNEFASADRLKEFTSSVYQILNNRIEQLPPHFQTIFPYMKEHDWLYNYQYRWGIEKSFEGLVRRATYLTESKIAFGLFNLYYDDMKICYDAFFPSLKKFAVHHLEQLLNG
jgi:acyl carrier protein phosphodiesterase